MDIPSPQLLQCPPVICPWGCRHWLVEVHQRMRVPDLQDCHSTGILAPVGLCLQQFKPSDILHDLAFPTAQALGQSWASQGSAADKNYLTGMLCTAWRWHFAPVVTREQAQLQAFPGYPSICFFGYPLTQAVPASSVLWHFWTFITLCNHHFLSTPYQVTTAQVRN